MWFFTDVAESLQELMKTSLNLSLVGFLEEKKKSLTLIMIMLATQLHTC